MNKTTLSAVAAGLALAGGPLLAQAQPGGGGRPAATAAPAPRSNGRITATITDAANGKPVSYATVAVINPGTNSQVSGGVAGDDGKIVLPVPAGTYQVNVSFIGYTAQTRTVTVPEAGGTVALGTIALAGEAQKLGEVVVTGRKPLIEERVDRTIYNADVDKTTQGGDASDVLRRVPQLSVDLDGNVSLRGSQNIRVLINNKPSTIAANSVADALRQIPADQIQTVEVITSPSAKYDAEGTGGIINIVTKSNNLRGGSLGINTSAGLRASNLGLNGNYRNGKFGVSLGGFGRASYNQPGSFDNTQSSVNLATSQRTSVRQTADTRRNDAFGRYTLGLTYDFDKRNSLAGSVAYGIRDADNYQDRLVSVTSAVSTGLNVGSLRDVEQTNTSRNIDASLNYTHVFEREQRELSVLTLYSRNNQLNNFVNHIYNYGSEQYLGDVGNDNKSYNEEYTGQLDYQTPTGKNQLLEAGVKDIVRRVNSAYTYFGRTDLQPVPPTDNTFIYNQNVAAGYLTYTLGLPKNFTVKPGLRYEYTSISARYTDPSQTLAGNIPDYGVLVPSVNVSRKFDNGNVVKASYNRRIQRPSLQFLNPNRQASNPLNATEGNPVLSPEYTNNYELGYSTIIKQKVNVNLTGFVRNTTQSIQALRTPLASGAVLTQYVNAGNEDAYGGSLFAGINSGKLSLNGSLDAYYAVLRNNDPNPIFNSRNEGLVTNARAFGSYNFNDKWALQLFGFYRGQQVQLQGEQSGFGIYSLSLQRSFAEKRGSIGFGAENFFTGSIRIRTNVASPYVDSYNGQPIYGPVISQNSTNVLHNLNFKLNFSYRIGKLTASDAPRRRKNVNNDDLKEGGDNGVGGGGDVSGGQGGGQTGAGGGQGGQRPAGAGQGQRPAGTYPGAGQRPAGAPGDSTQRRTQPADSTQRGAQPAGTPGRPGTAAPAVTPAASTPEQPFPAQPTPAQPTTGYPTRPATTPAGKPGTGTVPVGQPSPGTTSPSGIVPAGQTGGRP